MDEDKVMTRKQKAEHRAQEAEQSQSSKKPKPEHNGHLNGKSAEEVAREFENLRKAMEENLSVDQMREILEANGQDSSGLDGTVIAKWLVSLKLLLSTTEDKIQMESIVIGLALSVPV